MKESIRRPNHCPAEAGAEGEGRVCVGEGQDRERRLQAVLLSPRCFAAFSSFASVSFCPCPFPSLPSWPVARVVVSEEALVRCLLLSREEGHGAALRHSARGEKAAGGRAGRARGLVGMGEEFVEREEERLPRRRQHPQHVAGKTRGQRANAEGLRKSKRRLAGREDIKKGVSKIDDKGRSRILPLEKGEKWSSRVTYKKTVLSSCNTIASLDFQA